MKFISASPDIRVVRAGNPNQKKGAYRNARPTDQRYTRNESTYAAASNTVSTTSLNPYRWCDMYVKIESGVSMSARKRSGPAAK